MLVGYGIFRTLYFYDTCSRHFIQQQSSLGGGCCLSLIFYQFYAFALTVSGYQAHKVDAFLVSGKAYL